MKPGHTLLILTALGLGCPAGQAPCTDEDQDGYGAGSDRVACVYAEQDCDDGDPTINPGAMETCDGVDNDCDGLTDPGDSLGASSWWVDADGDGHGDPGGPTTACEQPTDYAETDDDCDDGDPAVNPDAEEVCNGIDDDCDGDVDDQDDAVTGSSTWYRDLDGDGYGDPDSALEACEQPDGWIEDSSDCNDGDDEVHPGAFDRTNGKDDDCDGDVDIVWLGGVHGTLLGNEDGDRAGSSLACVADFDGDGLADLLVGADEADTEAGNSGAAYLLSSAAVPTDGGSLSLAEASLVLISDDAGAAVGQDIHSIPDADADGLDDLLVGAQAWGQTGAVFLVPSALTGEIDIAEAARSILVGESLTRAGHAVAGGDFDGDGAPDALVGGWYRSDEAGIAWLVHDPAEGSTNLTDADTIIEGEGAGHAMGWDVASAGDVDGDGLDDWMVSAPYAHSSETGEVYLFTSGTAGSLTDSDATATMYGRYEYDHLGYAIEGRGDINGDGYDDMLLAARDYGEEEGRVYVMLGPKTGSMCVCGGSDGSMIGEAEGDRLGTSIAMGDVNHDGLADALFGATGSDTGGASAGAAYLWLGPMGGGTRWADEADARMMGASVDTSAGSSVALLPDLTGDDGHEMLVGADMDDTQGSDAGAVLLVLSPITRW